MNKQHNREGKLLLELQRDHGYTMGKLSRRDAFGFMMLGGNIVAVRCVKLMVPETSALGIAMRKGVQIPKRISKRISKQISEEKEGKKAPPQATARGARRAPRSEGAKP